MRALFTVALVTMGVGCVPNLAAPARSIEGYRASVGKAAGAAGSAVGTAGLVVEAGSSDTAFLPYLSITVSDAEDQLASATTTFISIEPPPDDEAAGLRRRAIEVLQRSARDVSDVRIAIRQGKPAALPPLTEALHRDADDLEALGP